MKFLSYTGDKKWAYISKENESDANESTEEHDPNLQKLNKLLTDILLSENLVVLCGLGTSLSVLDGNDKPIAPTMGDLWCAAKEKEKSIFEGVCKKVGYSCESNGANIELLLSRCQLHYELNHDHDMEEFIKKTEKIIVDKCRFVRDDIDLGAHEAFLRKVARRSTRLPRMQLFTVNYDTCFEAAASRTRFIVIDGFSHTHPQQFDGSYFGYDLVRREQDRERPDYIPNVLHLYKMHGSLDWKREAGQIIKEAEPEALLIIYPRDSKYRSSYDQPFLEMISRFQIALRQPNTGLIVIGFGFNDQHIYEPMMSAIRLNVGLKAIIVDPSLEDTAKGIESREPIKDIEQLIKGGDRRLTMLSAKFQQLVEFLPDLVAWMEQERHDKLIRQLGGRK